MKLTEEQKQAIVDDVVKQMQDVIDEPYDHINEEFDYDEDDWGNSYNRGSHHFSQELEEICIDGLPCLDKDNSDVGICAEFDGYLTFHDDYEPGDYWTPPSGGVEIDSIELTLKTLEIEVSLINPDNGEYEYIEVTEGEIKALIQRINKRIVNKPPYRSTRDKRIAV